MTFPPSRPLETVQRVIVVGASSGIGAALTRQLAARGDYVAALARREDALTALADGLENVVAYPHDVTDFDAVPALFRRIVGDLNGLDQIYYVAGVMPPIAPDEFDFEKDRQMVEVNLLGAMRWLNCAAERFGRTKTGHIIGISSVSGDRGRAPFPGYGTSKAGLTTYLEALRNRLGAKGVTVTTVKPGFVETQMLENASRTFWVISADEAARQILKVVAAKRQTVYIPGRWRYLMLVIRSIPSFIFRRLGI